MRNFPKDFINDGLENRSPDFEPKSEHYVIVAKSPYHLHTLHITEHLHINSSLTVRVSHTHCSQHTGYWATGRSSSYRIPQVCSHRRNAPEVPGCDAHQQSRVLEKDIFALLWCPKDIHFHSSIYTHFHFTTYYTSISIYQNIHICYILP
jgi:hypothetical protein